MLDKSHLMEQSDRVRWNIAGYDEYSIVLTIQVPRWWVVLYTGSTSDVNTRENGIGN